MTQTGTLFSKAIKFYTKSSYNHISIGFDKHLQKLYSFGRKKPHNPIIAGFVQEGINKGIYEIFKDTTCRIYKLDISEIEYAKLKSEIELFNKDKDQYKYNLLGLIALIFGISFKRERHYFCTQFVAKVLYTSKIVDFGKDFSLVQPHDFYEIEKAKLVYEGKLSEYSPHKLYTA